MPNREARPREAGTLTQWTQPYTPLNSSLEQVLIYVQDDPSLKWLEKLKTHLEKRSQRKYCWFYRDHGHNTEDYYYLKEQIKMFIQ